MEEHLISMIAISCCISLKLQFKFQFNFLWIVANSIHIQPMDWIKTYSNFLCNYFDDVIIGGYFECWTFNHCDMYHCSKVWGQWVFVFEIYTFIKQGCIKLIKSDSKYFQIILK